MEIKPMKSEIDAAIKAIIVKAKDAVQPHDAMQFAQAALNLAQLEVTLSKECLLKN